MSKSTHQEPAPFKHSLDKDGATVTRRTVLAGAAAAQPPPRSGVDIPALAPGCPNPYRSGCLRDAFVRAHGNSGRQSSSRSPIRLIFREEYFNWVSGLGRTRSRRLHLRTLLQIERSTSLARSADDGIIKQPDVDRLVKGIETQGDEPKYLARSIVLMWYLGSWYEPDDLKTLPRRPHRHSSNTP